MNSLQNLFGLSFSSKLNSIQSSFQTAQDKAVTLISKMNDKISEKEAIVSIDTSAKTSWDSTL